MNLSTSPNPGILSTLPGYEQPQEWPDLPTIAVERDSIADKMLNAAAGRVHNAFLLGRAYVETAHLTRPEAYEAWNDACARSDGLAYDLVDTHGHAEPLVVAVAIEINARAHRLATWPTPATLKAQAEIKEMLMAYAREIAPRVPTKAHLVWHSYKQGDLLHTTLN